VFALKNAPECVVISVRIRELCMPDVQTNSALPGGPFAWRSAVGRVARWLTRSLLPVPPTAAAPPPASEAALTSIEVQKLDRLVAERTAELEKARAEAEEANRAKALFLANISHELRTPMHAVLSYAQLGRDAAPGEQREYFERIAERGQALLHMLSDLLDLSRLEAGSMSMEFAPYDIESLARDAVSTIAKHCAKRGVRFEVQRLPNCERCRVLADSVLLGKAFSNLLENAARFSPQGGVVRVLLSNVSIENEPGFGAAGLTGIEIAVIDHGVGIPEAELESVFDKFVQSSKTRTNAGGTGLGLAICRAIVQVHGGRIWASNNRGPGATLHVVLPLAVGAGRGTV
jgi:signal transduction histidine kinase